MALIWIICCINRELMASQIVAHGPFAAGIAILVTDIDSAVKGILLSPVTGTVFL